MLQKESKQAIATVNDCNLKSIALISVEIGRLHNGLIFLKCLICIENK